MVKWELVSFVSRSKLRVEILTLLRNPSTPTQLAKQVKSSVTHISRELRHFKDRKLVDCLTPNERVWKLYKITKLGEEVLQKANNVENKQN